tara:strand:- start:418 stop:561 length:144 start_codon:yes stop_codon:yes gene_type:complete
VCAIEGAKGVRKRGEGIKEKKRKEKKRKKKKEGKSCPNSRLIDFFSS